MKRLSAIVAVAVVAFAFGAIVRDINASGVGGGGSSATLASPATGGSLGLTGTLAVSGAVTFTAAVNGTTIPTSKTLVATTDNMSVLAATTSAQLYGVLSDETGSASGSPVAVFSVSPTLVGAVVVTGPTGSLTITGTESVSSTSTFTGLTTMNGGITDIGAVGISGNVAITGQTVIVANSGIGITATGTSASPGGSFTGGGTNGAGVVGQGGASTGAGGSFTGGSSGRGVIGQGGATTGDGVRGIGTGSGFGGNFSSSSTGGGISVDSSSGTGLAASFTADTTSPTLGLIALVPQDTNPSAACSIGTIFDFTGGYIRMCTATTPAWNDVSGFNTVVTGLTAATGASQATGTAVCASGNQSTIGTTATDGDAVTLPATPVVGQKCTIYNKGAKAAALYPGSGDALCLPGAACLSANSSTLIPALTGAIYCYAEDTATWNCGYPTNPEYVSSTVAVASGVTGATTVDKNITSISLPAGDWDVTGICGLDTNITGTEFACGITSTSATMPASTARGDTWVQTPTVSSTAADSTLTVPNLRIVITTTTTEYLVSHCTDSGGTCTMYGRLSARRRR